MTHKSRVLSLAAALGLFAAAGPLAAQGLDPDIAPNSKLTPRIPRPAAPGTALLDDGPVTKTADNSANANRTMPGAARQLTDEEMREAARRNFKIDPELDKLLGDWEIATRNVQRLNGNFRQFTYDEVFQTESRATGKFYYQAPDKGLMEFKGADLSRPAQDLEIRKDGSTVNPLKLAPNKQPFQVKSREDEIWNCTGKEILQIYPKKKVYNRVAIPQQFQGESIKESPLPFLFGLRKEEAKERYIMQRGSMDRKPLRGFQNPPIHVVAFPLRQQDSREWSRAEVLLDSATFLPKSIRTVDPAGTSESVYNFDGVETNARWLFSDPFTTKMVAGMQLIEDREAGPPQSSSVPTGPTGKSTIPTSNSPFKGGQLPLK